MNDASTRKDRDSRPSPGDQVVVRMDVVEAEGDMVRLEPTDGVGGAWVPVAHLLADPGSLMPLEPRYNGFWDCPTNRIREIIDDVHGFAWPRRLAAGRALVDREETDECAMDAYGALTCDPVAHLRLVGVQGAALGRGQRAVEVLLGAIEDEVHQPLPSSAVVLTVLRALEAHESAPVTRPEGRIDQILDIWERCNNEEIQTAAARIRRLWAGFETALETGHDSPGLELTDV